MVYNIISYIILYDRYDSGLSGMEGERAEREMEIHESAYIADGAIVFGDVYVGEESSIWFHATVRGDRGKIYIGNRSNIQDDTVVHVDPDFPVSIGNYVTVGHGAVIHGCRIEDNTLVGMGAIVLNGARIGKNCIVGAGALITKNMAVPDNSLVIGSPAKIIRKVTEQEMEANRLNAKEYVEESRKYKEGGIKMEFFEKVGETIAAKGKDVADKAKDFAEIASLRSQISTCEEVMKKNYLEIGKLYYEQFKEAEYNDFIEQCTAITNAKNGVEALEEKIREIKGV